MQGLVLEVQPLVPHQCQTFCWQHLQKEHKAKLDAHVQKCVFAWMVSLLSNYRHHRLISECDSPMAFTALAPAVCPSSRDWINTSLLLSPPTRVSCAEEGSIHGYCVLCMPVYVSVCVCVCARMNLLWPQPGKAAPEQAGLHVCSNKAPSQPAVAAAPYRRCCTIRCHP